LVEQTVSPYGSSANLALVRCLLFISVTCVLRGYLRNVEARDTRLSVCRSNFVSVLKPTVKEEFWCYKSINMNLGCTRPNIVAILIVLSKKNG